MAKSSRLRQLLSRIYFLEKNLLPRAKPTGNYTKKEQDFIRSYVLLCHAEIESYFEDRAKERANKAFDKWKKSGRANNCLVAILVFSGGELNFNNGQKKYSNQVEDREDKIKKAVSHFRETVERNHGIKEKNIKNLLVPIGIKFDDIDSTWLQEMNTFGKFRGGIAHTAFKTQTQLDVKSEQDRINNRILPEIDVLDTLISKLK